MLDQMLASVSTRRFERTREPVEAEGRSVSHSTVSREFVARTLMSRRLDDVLGSDDDRRHRTHTRFQSPFERTISVDERFEPTTDDLADLPNARGSYRGLRAADELPGLGYATPELVGTLLNPDADKQHARALESVSSHALRMVSSPSPKHHSSGKFLTSS